jgi:hypothetical protein
MSDSWIRPYEENLPSDMIVMPVTGYRIWYVPLQPILQIRSYWIQTEWRPFQKVEAECRNHMSCVCAGEFWTSTKREPEEEFACSCSAGIYAWRTFDQGFEMYMDEVEKMFGMDAPEPTTNRVCFGKVYLWGKMIECEKGFRAQYAYPAGFYYTADNTRALAAMYSVPLLTIKDHHEPHLCP